MFNRRSLLAAIPALGLATRMARAAGDQVLRVGFQKGEGILLAARENHTLETLLKPAGIEVRWIEFQFGPPMLEAMRAGAIDLGGVGDTPPIFAQAAHSDLLYTAAQRAGESAILLPPGSKLQTLADLKGRRVAFGKGSSAHNLTIAALEKAGLSLDQIQPVYLGPADAAAAFERGAIDAWTVWDPYYALVEARPGVRVLAKSTEIVEQNSFFIAQRSYVESNPAIIERIVGAIRALGGWARDHREALAHSLSDTTGLPLEAIQRSVARTSFEVFAMNDDVTASQQVIADRFLRLGVIPDRIRVADAVWRAQQS